MTINHFPFRVLFSFEDQNQIVIEIKRTDIQSEDKIQVYKWLQLSKNTLQIIPLTFQSMDESNGDQMRIFAEGTLTWNSDSAQFEDTKMTAVNSEEFKRDWLQAISGFLA